MARGTARSIGHLSPYVAGKTGTTDDANDGWFVGFTNDVTVATWVGYDNADEQHRTLGDGETGARVALPIFEPIIEAVWADYAPRTVLAPPSPRAQRQLADLPIDLNSGVREDRRHSGGFIEHFHLNPKGEVDDTRYRLVADEEPRPERKRIASSPFGQGPCGGRRESSNAAPAGRRAVLGMGRAVGQRRQPRAFRRKGLLNVEIRRDRMAHPAGRVDFGSSCRGFPHR